MASTSKKSTHKRRAKREPYVETPEMYTEPAKRQHYKVEPDMYTEQPYTENSYADDSAVGNELVPFKGRKHSPEYSAGGKFQS